MILTLVERAVVADELQGCRNHHTGAVAGNVLLHVGIADHNHYSLGEEEVGSSADVVGNRAEVEGNRAEVEGNQAEGNRAENQMLQEVVPHSNQEGQVVGKHCHKPEVGQ